MRSLPRRTHLALAWAAGALGAGCSAARHPSDAAAPSAGAAVWVTTADRARLLARDRDLAFEGIPADSPLPIITVDATRRYQTIVGWGAAMTDASAYLIEHSMRPSQREALLEELFGRRAGIGLSVMRVPIGASDFSRTHYSHDDVPAGSSDPTLAHFNIDADRAEKLPVIKRALEINPGLWIMGSPWSAPGWMKTTGSLIRGTLKPESSAPFAEYLRRWVAAYAAEGVPVAAVSLQNEPHFEPADYPGMRLSPAQRADLIAHHVGPLFAAHGMTTKILDWDHNWDEPASPLAVLADSAARRYVSGVAWHCYAGSVSAQDSVHRAYPEKESWFTECSGGDWAPNWGDNLLWNSSTLVIGTARGWARGVMLWNLALDERHGPHLGGCGNCRGVVTIAAATGEVTRNPEYYALAHASRFVRPGAARVESSAATGLESVAFANADDGSTVLIVVNASSSAAHFGVRAGVHGFTYAMPARAVATFVWR